MRYACTEAQDLTGKRAEMNALCNLQSRLADQGYQVSLNILAPGTIFGEHCNADARIDAVFSGQLRVVISGVPKLLGPGDWVEIPAGAMMSAEVVGEEPVFRLYAARD